MEKVLHFIKYNNAFTIIFVVLFFGFGVTFAASPTVRESVYASEETVTSVDNSEIVSADLNNFNFNLKINSVTEDGKNYYAAYSYQTLAIENGFWQKKDVEKTLTVNKEALGGKDLGLYVAKELGENINYELSYLQRVQKLEREKGESQKVVTVEYSGLVGKLLDPKEMVIEGYTPVVPEPVPEVPATIESNPEEVIVSTPYTKPEENTVPPTPPVPPQTEPTQETTQASSTLPQTESAQESGSATSTPPQTEPPQEQVSSSTPSQTEPQQEQASTTTPVSEQLPAPEEMVDEELVQEVVGQLLQDQPTSTPESASTPAPAPETAPEPTP